jgi:hypothetical protein
MSVRIQLDAPAVRAIIASDATFDVELKRAIVAEVVRGLVLRDAQHMIELLEPVAVAKLQDAINSDHWIRIKLDEAATKLIERDPKTYSGMQPSAATKQRLESVLKPFLDEQVRRISSGMQSEFAAAADKLMADMDGRVERRLERIVEERMAAEVDRRVKAKMDAILAAVKP